MRRLGRESARAGRSIRESGAARLAQSSHADARDPAHHPREPRGVPVGARDLVVLVLRRGDPRAAADLHARRGRRRPERDHLLPGALLCRHGSGLARLREAVGPAGGARARAAGLDRDDLVRDRPVPRQPVGAAGRRGHRRSAGAPRGAARRANRARLRAARRLLRAVRRAALRAGTAALGAEPALAGDRGQQHHRRAVHGGGLAADGGAARAGRSAALDVRDLRAAERSHRLLRVQDDPRVPVPLRLLDPLARALPTAHDRPRADPRRGRGAPGREPRELRRLALHRERVQAARSLRHAPGLPRDPRSGVRSSATRR